MNLHVRPFILLTAAICLPAAAQADPFFVSVDGGYLIAAENSAGSPASINYGDASAFTGYLDQTSVSIGPLSKSETGITRGPDGTLAQEADATVQATAAIGALHAVVSAVSQSSDAATQTRAQANLNLIWSDTVTFSVTNPEGADFTATLVLDDTISGSVEAGFIAGSATAFMTDSLPLGFIPFDAITDTTSAPTPIDSASSTIHVTDGARVTFTGKLEVNAFAEDTASVAVDAADTAGFFLTTNDPNASYSTASGARFDVPAPTTAPEPSSAMILLAGLAGLGLASRRMRHAVVLAAPAGSRSAAASSIGEGVADQDRVFAFGAGRQ